MLPLHHGPMKVAEGNRTLNLRIHTPLLCQLSYDHSTIDGVRTHDLPRMKRTLFLLSYDGVLKGGIEPPALRVSGGHSAC